MTTPLGFPDLFQVSARYVCNGNGFINGKKSLRGVMSLFSQNPAFRLSAGGVFFERLQYTTIGDTERRPRFLPSSSNLLNPSFAVCGQSQRRKTNKSRVVICICMHCCCSQKLSPPSVEHTRHTLTRGSGRRRACISPPLSYCTTKR